MRSRWKFTSACVALLGILGACGGEEDDNNAGSEACQAVAGAPEVVGDGTSVELIRAERTTEQSRDRWAATRHGPDGPSSAASRGPALSGATVYACVFRTSGPRPISMPEGATADTSGVRVLVRSGTITVDAIGDPNRLSRDLDSLGR